LNILGVGLFGDVILIIAFFFARARGDEDLVAGFSVYMFAVLPLFVLMLFIIGLANGKGGRDWLWLVMTFLLSPLITIPLLLILPSKRQDKINWRELLFAPLVVIILFSFWGGLVLLLDIFFLIVHRNKRRT
jgi:hypothetical protein